MSKGLLDAEDGEERRLSSILKGLCSELARRKRIAVGSMTSSGRKPVAQIDHGKAVFIAMRLNWE